MTMAIAADIVQHDTYNSCVVCRCFHESGELASAHVISHLVDSANAVDMTQGTLDMYPRCANGKSISILRDSWAKPVGIKKILVKEKGYTGKRVISWKQSIANLLWSIYTRHS